MESELQKYNSGLRHDELSWNDVAMYASKKIGEFKKKVIFVTYDTAISTPSIIDEMKKRLGASCSSRNIGE